MKKLTDVRERIADLLRLEGTLEPVMSSSAYFDSLRALASLVADETTPTQRAFVHWDCEPCGTVNPLGMMCADCHGTMNAPRCVNGVAADATMRPDVCRTCDLRPKCLWPNEGPGFDTKSGAVDLRTLPKAHPYETGCAEGCGGCSKEHERRVPRRPQRIEVTDLNGKDLHAAVVAEMRAVETRDDHDEHTTEAMRGPSGLTQAELKLDDGKIDWTYLPFDALESVVRVLMWAASRGGPYARDSWREIAPHPTKGTPDARSLRSAVRHIVQDLRGELLDPASQEAHLAHAVCQLLFAIAHRRMSVTVTRKEVK